MKNIVQIFNNLQDRLDNYQRQNKLVGFCNAVIKKYSEDEAGYRAALLTYYAFLAIFPLLLVLTTVLKLVFHNYPGLRSQIMDAAFTYFPLIGNDLQQNIHGLGNTGWALAVGVLLTLYGARGVANAFRTGLNHLWGVPFVGRGGFPGTLLRSLGIVLLGGMGLLLAPVLSGYAVGFSHGWNYRILSFLVTAIILFWVFVMITRLAIAKSFTLKNIWLGTLIVVVGLLILQSLGTYLLTHQLRNLNNLYGTFALVLGLMFWLYLQAQLIFYAVEVDVVRTKKLWPRSLRSSKTMADERAYKFYTARDRYNRH